MLMNGHFIQMLTKGVKVTKFLYDIDQLKPGLNEMICILSYSAKKQMYVKPKTCSLIRYAEELKILRE